MCHKKDKICHELGLQLLYKAVACLHNIEESLEEIREEIAELGGGGGHEGEECVCEEEEDEDEDECRACKEAEEEEEDEEDEGRCRCD
jgi:ribosomal protein L12E/L44/L45/RPP1/RPP2